MSVGAAMTADAPLVAEPLTDDGDIVLVRGHVDAATFMAASWFFDREEDIADDDLEHVWAIEVHVDGEDGYRWDGCTAQTPGAFAATVWYA